MTWLAFFFFGLFIGACSGMTLMGLLVISGRDTDMEVPMED